MLLEDCTELRDLLAGVAEDPRIGSALFPTAGALDALIDPLEPPPPWSIPAVDDVEATLLRAAAMVHAAIDEPRPVAELIALGMCGRHIAEALEELRHPGGWL